MKKLTILALSFMFCCSIPAFAADDRGVAVKGKVSAQVAGMERKIALVIGNSTYLVSPLKNPANDAKAMSKALRDLGFDVDERKNLGLIEMKQAIEAFGRSIKKGGVGLFFYAGHGMQVDGRNYLIPIDANIEGEAEVDFKAVDAGLVLAKMDMAKNDMNIVILDACRNNPFSRNFRAANPGLATMNAPSGTLIAYATSPGSVASDGTGENGLYTREVVRTIKKPGLKIEDAFKQVRASVQKETGGKQVPWESSSLVGDFYFAGLLGGADTSRLQGLAEGSKERQQELERLRKLEADSAKQKQKEQSEIAKKEKELAALDAQILEMKNKLGTSAAGPNDNLKKMVAMVEKKEEDARKIEELKKQREAEEAKRQAKIEKLKKEAEEKRKAEIEKDIANFEKIASSPYGKDLIPSAWKSLTTKFASAEGVEKIEVGNVRALRLSIVAAIELVLVKGGCFQMGDTFGNDRSDDKPVHEVCVADFSIGRYEVTQTQWEAVMGNNPSNFKGCGGKCPVEEVSWNDVQEFIRKLNSETGKTYRLPTEAEWEYAARSGGKIEKYSGGDDLDSIAWYSSNSGKQTHAVGQKKPNGLGLYDITGNVWEWVADWYDENYYRSSPRDNPQGANNGQFRSLRGRSWNDNTGSVRTSDRDRNNPETRYSDIGFRLARSAQ